MQEHYHALYKAIRRAVSFLKTEGYNTVTVNLKSHPFQIVASNGKQTRHLRVMITPKGHLPDYSLILKGIADTKLPTASIKELWVWEIRTGWHFYPVEENKE